MFLRTRTMTLGSYIKRRRKELRLTQSEVSHALSQRGIHRTGKAVAGWENEYQQVPVEYIPALAEILKVSVTTLYEHAGILASLPGREIIRLLDGLPEDELRRIQAMITAYVKQVQN